MAEISKIEWTDATWNPITGCSVVSPGCTNCYAMRLAGTRLQHHPSRAGLTKMSKAGPVWTGEVRLNQDWLMQPLRWKRPRRIFVCAHGDLFHEGVPDEWIDKMFAVMAAASKHTFQVLTKRADRMAAYCNTLGRHHSADRVSLSAKALKLSEPFFWTLGAEGCYLPNVWLGTSTEDQSRADERLPHLRKIPAAVRFVSAEPLLGQVNFEPYFDGIDWLIVGGESGPGWRDMHPAWVAEIVENCRAYHVPVFVKQMAGKRPIPPNLMIRQFPEARDE